MSAAVSETFVRRSSVGVCGCYAPRRILSPTQPRPTARASPVAAAEQNELTSCCGLTGRHWLGAPPLETDARLAQAKADGSQVMLRIDQVQDPDSRPPPLFWGRSRDRQSGSGSTPAWVTGCGRLCLVPESRWGVRQRDCSVAMPPDQIPSMYSRPIVGLASASRLEHGGQVAPSARRFEVILLPRHRAYDMKVKAAI
jgi:hypothetical protein